MFSTIVSGYDTYQTYKDEDAPKKVQKLIREMELRLRLLPEGNEKEALKARIKSIKTAVKTRHVNVGLLRTGVQLAKGLIGNLTGPLGSGIAAYAAHEILEKCDDEKNGVIVKAKMKAKARKFSKNKAKTRSATQEAAKATFCGFAGKVALGTLFAVCSYTYGRSLIFG